MALPPTLSAFRRLHANSIAIRAAEKTTVVFPPELRQTPLSSSRDAPRQNCGFTLIHAETGVPIARLRPIERDDLVVIL